jgi:hypothetical protein
MKHKKTFDLKVSEKKKKAFAVLLSPSKMLLFGFIVFLAFQSSFCIFDSESSEEYRQKRNFVLGSRKDFVSVLFKIVINNLNDIFVGTFYTKFHI